MSTLLPVSRRSPGRSSLKRRILCVAAVGLMPPMLGGCVTGSSASFTQAPIFFAEASDASGDPVANADEGGSRSGTTAVEPSSLSGNAYLAVAGNATLPVSSAARPAILMTDAVQSREAAALLSTAGAASSAKVATLLGTALDASPAGEHLSAMLSGEGVAIGAIAPASVLLPVTPQQSAAGLVVPVVTAVAAPASSAVASVGSPAVQLLAATSPAVAVTVPSPPIAPVTAAPSVVIPAVAAVSVQPSAASAPTVSVSQVLTTHGSVLGSVVTTGSSLTQPALIGSTMPSIMRACGMKKCVG